MCERSPLQSRDQPPHVDFKYVVLANAHPYGSPTGDQVKRLSRAKKFASGWPLDTGCVKLPPCYAVYPSGARVVQTAPFDADDGKASFST